MLRAVNTNNGQVVELKGNDAIVVAELQAQGMLKIGDNMSIVFWAQLTFVGCMDFEREYIKPLFNDVRHGRGHYQVNILNEVADEEV